MTEFRSLGEFLQSVARARAGDADQRLVRAPTGAGETDPTAGGFLVPTTFVEKLVTSLFDEAVVAPLCFRMETDRPLDVRLPGIDETSRANGSRWGGASAYWAGEGDSETPSLPKFRRIEYQAHKMIAFCVASAELIADAPLLGAYVTLAFKAEMGFKLDAAIVAGTGAGEPLGVLNSATLIKVAKDVSQPAATISPGNVENMWAALPVPCRRRAVWLVNELAEQQISNASFVSPTSVGLYMPQGAAGNEVPLLKGRPMIAIEQASALGTPGDIIVGDFSQYGIVDGGLKAALSMDVDFASDQGVYRFSWRVDGKPLWSSPIASYSDGAARSPFVATAQR